MDSFFGNLLYEKKVSKDHVVRKLDEVIHWDRFSTKLLGYYKSKGKIGTAII